MQPGINRVAKDIIYVMPDFIHEFGDDVHHWSARSFNHFRYVLHQFLDLWVFYPIQSWMRKWIGDNKVYEMLRPILGFFWGLNCGFSLRDVALYTVWDYRGCAPIAVFKNKEGTWIQTYPNSKVKETDQ